ncbi:MAG: sulfate/thiosulfate transport system permease protein [Blastocatellia bacterium]|nr:sulfate/thiosulfate transport system permease protein [Blastocatellia bacterium]
MSTALNNSLYQPRAMRHRPWGKWGLRGTAFLYLGVMIALPLLAVVKTGIVDGPAAFLRDIATPTAVGALKLTLILALFMTAINAVVGTLTAYVLVRYQFPGRKLLNALVDAPFAIPTLVTGVMLVVLYGPQQFLGAWFESHGIRIIFDRPGIVLALLFVTYPFVIRTVQPVLLELKTDQEEAAYTMGASKWMTFRTIVLPNITPAIITGSLLSFARALGEFGSVVAVAGNIPGRTLTAPVYLYGQIESQNIRSASAISILLLAISFSLMLAVDTLQHRGWKSNVHD